jgi:hypothetical protein
VDTVAAWQSLAAEYPRLPEYDDPQKCGGIPALCSGVLGAPLSPTAEKKSISYIHLAEIFIIYFFIEFSLATLQWANDDEEEEEATIQ